MPSLDGCRAALAGFTVQGMEEPRMPFTRRLTFAHLVTIDIVAALLLAVLGGFRMVPAAGTAAPWRAGRCGDLPGVRRRGGCRAAPLAAADRAGGDPGRQSVTVFLGFTVDPMIAVAAVLYTVGLVKAARIAMGALIPVGVTLAVLVLITTAGAPRGSNSGRRELRPGGRDRCRAAGRLGRGPRGTGRARVHGGTARAGRAAREAKVRPGTAGDRRGAAADRPGTARRGRPQHERRRRAGGCGRVRDRQQPRGGGQGTGRDRDDQPHRAARDAAPARSATGRHSRRDAVRTRAGRHRGPGRPGRCAGGPRGPRDAA